MLEKQLLPVSPPPERAIDAATANIITKIGELIQEEAASASNEWAEAEKLENDNIFMNESVQRILAANIAGFISQMQPRAHQFTDAHASAFLGIEPAGEVLP
jgi:hypothetical protein